MMFIYCDLLQKMTQILVVTLSNCRNIDEQLKQNLPKSSRKKPTKPPIPKRPVIQMSKRKETSCM